MLLPRRSSMFLRVAPRVHAACPLLSAREASCPRDTSGPPREEVVSLWIPRDVFPGILHWHPLLPSGKHGAGTPERAADDNDGVLPGGIALGHKHRIGATSKAVTEVEARPWRGLALPRRRAPQATGTRGMFTPARARTGLRRVPIPCPPGAMLVLRPGENPRMRGLGRMASLLPLTTSSRALRAPPHFSDPRSTCSPLSQDDWEEES
jgi:hypothetical protein